MNNIRTMTYAEWMKAIDQHLLGLIFLDQDSLPDWLSRDAYESGLSVVEGAEQCMEDAGMGFLNMDEKLLDEA